MTTNINITMNVNNNEARKCGRKPRAIKCNEDGKTFCSILDAAKYYHVHHGNIWAVLNGKRNHTNNLTFCYINDDENSDNVAKTVNESKPKRIKDITVQKEAVVTAEGKRDHKNCKFVMCITDGKYFTSVTDAAEHYGIAGPCISRACHGQSKTANGKQFCFLNDIPLYLKEISNAINKSNAYDILVEKERLRKELIADVDKCKDDVYAIEMKLCEAKQALEKAQHALATFN